LTAEEKKEERESEGKRGKEEGNCHMRFINLSLSLLPFLSLPAISLNHQTH
jgi:hypothetical protein